jgi:hypothetical protein
VTRITLQDGKIVIRDGKVGTEEACCCGGACDCPPDCVDGLEVSIGNNPICSSGSYSDFIAENQGFTTFSAFMICVDGLWLVSLDVLVVDLNNFTFCAYTYTANLAPEADCLPPAGVVDLTLVLVTPSGPDVQCDPPELPTVTINKNPLP